TALWHRPAATASRPCGRRWRGRPEPRPAHGGTPGTGGYARLRAQCLPARAAAWQTAPDRRVRYVRSCSCCECLSQRRQCAADSCLYRAQRLAGHLRNLGVGKAIEEGHLQRLSLLQRKLADHAARLLYHMVTLNLIGQVVVGGERHLV